jgi:hypothetical protein
LLGLERGGGKCRDAEEATKHSHEGLPVTAQRRAVGDEMEGEDRRCASDAKGNAGQPVYVGVSRG